MTQAVGRDGFENSGSLSILFENLPETLPGHRFASPCDKQEWAGVRAKKGWSGCCHIKIDFLPGWLSKWHHAFLGTFSKNTNATAVQVDILKFHGNQLRYPKPCGVHQLYHRCVANARRLFWDSACLKAG